MGGNFPRIFINSNTFSRFVKGIFFFTPRFISEEEKAQRRKWQRNHRPPPPPPLFPCTQIPQKEGPLREEILIRRPSLPPFPNRPLIEESSRHFFGKRGEGGRRKSLFIWDIGWVPPPPPFPQLLQKNQGWAIFPSSNFSQRWKERKRNPFYIHVSAAFNFSWRLVTLFCLFLLGKLGFFWYWKKKFLPFGPLGQS